MGSSLSEQERIGLEEVFLSISHSGNFPQRWSNWGKNFIFNLNAKLIPLPLNIRKNSKTWFENSLKTHKITKLFNKMQKRRKI